MDSFNTVASAAFDMPKLDMSASAASRQKSCNACVRGKRRCDKRSPRCTRCAAKGLECVYQKLPPSATTSATSVNASVTTTSTGESAGTTPEMTDLPDFDMNFDMDSMGTETSPESLHHQAQHHHISPPVGLNLGPELDFDIVDFMNSGSESGITTGTGSLFNFNTTFGNENKMQLPDIPTVPQPNLDESPAIRDVAILRPEEACIIIDPSDAHDKRTISGFMVKELTILPTAFAKTRSTSFMHPRLWSAKLPKTMLTIFSAATAYSNVTPDNKSWIMKLINSSAMSIHRDGENASTHTEKLARLQALLLLDVMRVFDGDIALRAAAERERSVLISWMTELQVVRAELDAEAALWGGGSIPLKERPPRTWESWILLESVRRTLAAVCAFICLTTMLKSEEPPTEIWSCTTFTASRHLWDAASSTEFYRAWREKPQYLIQEFDFKAFWQHGRMDDMDEFTRLMLTPQVGVEAMEHFTTGDISIPL